MLITFAEIIVGLRRLTADDPADRRYVLTGFSRYAQTPPALRLELNVGATEYLCLPDPDPDAFSDDWPRVTPPQRAPSPTNAKIAARSQVNDRLD